MGAGTHAEDDDGGGDDHDDRTIKEKTERNQNKRHRRNITSLVVLWNEVF